MNSGAPSVWSKLGRFASSIAPGVFLIGYVIGTGSVTTMAAAGAKYGMSLTWTLVLASFFTGMMFIAISKSTIVTGDTLFYSFKIHFGRAVTIFIILGLMTTQIASIIGVMAIVSDVVREFSRPLTADGTGIPPLASAIFFTALLYGLFWHGKHAFFLKVLAFLVALMGVSFLLTMVLVMPSAAEVFRGFIPSVPAEGNPQLLIAGMVGTTMASVCLFTRSILVREKGWGPDDLPVERRDSIISVTLMLVINTAIMACAAGTMYVRGLEVEQAIDMVRTLEPLAGRLAVSGFVVGIVAAGLSSLFPNYLLGPWLISDYFGLSRNVNTPGYRVLVLACALMGLVVPIFGGQPVPIMIASQAVSPLVMPLIAVMTMVLLNRKAIVGRYQNGVWMNAGLAITVLFCIYMLYLSVVGFLGVLG